MILLVTATALIVSPQVIALPAQAAEDPGIVSKLNSVLSDSRTQRAKTGAVVLDAKTGELLYSRYGKRSVMPASNTKIVTAVAAMHVLTPTFRFQDFGHPAGRGGGRDSEGPAVPQGLWRSDHPPG